MEDKDLDRYLPYHRCIVCKEIIDKDDCFVSAHNCSPLSSDKFGCAPIRSDLFHFECYANILPGFDYLKTRGLI